MRLSFTTRAPTSLRRQVERPAITLAMLRKYSSQVGLICPQHPFADQYTVVAVARGRFTPFYEIGRVTVKVVPCPSRLWTLMAPPRVHTSSLDIDRPRPEPPVFCERDFSTR